MKTSKHSLTTEDLDLFCDFLERGYPILDSLDLLSLYQNKVVFKEMKREMLKGKSLQEVLLDFSVDQDWLEYFLFISQFATLTKAMQGASALLKTKEKFAELLKQRLRYPLCLMIGMVLFAIATKNLLLPQLENLLLSFNLNSKLALSYQLILYLPFGLIVLSFLSFALVFNVVSMVKRRNFQKLQQQLYLPVIGKLLQYYYSIKFASYFATLTLYVNGLKDTISLMYEKMTHSDLMVVIYPMKKSLEDGASLISCIDNCPFFHESFKKHFLLLYEMGKSFERLNDYVFQSSILLERKLTLWMKIVVSLIYGFTGFFIIAIYLVLMMPMMNMAANL